MSNKYNTGLALYQISILMLLSAILSATVSGCGVSSAPTGLSTAEPSPTNTPVVVSPSATPTKADVSGFQKGMTFVSWQNGQYSTLASDQSLTDLASTGANWVAILVTGYQKTANNTQINITEITPSDDALVHVISKAHELGLKVLLKPHVDIQKSGQWRGEIAFSKEEDWNAWFNSYRQFINHYADLAQKTNAEAFTVGTELVKTSGRSADWESIVEDVRSRFDGKLTYASNFDEVQNVKWWKSLDYIGVDAYYPLRTTSDDPTVEGLEAAWINSGYLTDLKKISEEYDRPILLTEIGYRPVKGANNAPWQWQDNPQIDLPLQANLYEAALKTFSKEEWVAGMFFWNWLTDPNQGGETDPDYTPKGKPAEDVLKKYYHQ